MSFYLVTFERSHSIVVGPMSADQAMTDAHADLCRYGLGTVFGAPVAAEELLLVGGTGEGSFLARRATP